jgi:hypothetical protein
MRKIEMNNSLLGIKSIMTIITTLTLIAGCASINPAKTDISGSIEIERAGSQKANIREVNIQTDEEQLTIYGSITKTLNQRGHILGHLHIEAFDKSETLLGEIITDYRRQNHNSAISKFSVTLKVDPEDVARIGVIHHGTTTSYRPNRNPLPITADVVSAGESIYQNNCMGCHDSLGKGDGEEGVNLTRKPADIASFSKTSFASDAYLYWMIYEGGTSLKTGMPSFGGVLTNEEIWQVAIYLRQL